MTSTTIDAGRASAAQVPRANMRWLSLVSPIAAFVFYRLAAVGTNFGTSLDYGQLALLAVATLGISASVGYMLMKIGLAAERLGFAITIHLLMATSPIWGLVDGLQPSDFAARVSPLVLPVLVAVVAYQVQSRAVPQLFIIFFVLAGLLQVTTRSVGYVQAERTIEPEPLVLPEPTSQKDFVVIVLDEYARSDVLASDYGFDNSEFLHELAQKGIAVVPQAWANTNRTINSVATMMSGQNLVLPGGDYTDKDRRRLAEIIGGDSPLVDTLKANGYRYTHIEGPATDTRCGKNVDTCISNGLNDDLTLAWFQFGLHQGVLTSTVGHPYPASAGRILGNLQNALAEATTNETPDFIYAHVLSPHVPYGLDARCDRHQPRGDYAANARADYVRQIRCINTMVVDSLRELNDDTVVVVTGDHGPLDDRGLLFQEFEEWGQADLRQRLAVFSSLKMTPECQRPPDDATVATITHHGFSCAIGIVPMALDDQVFLVKEMPFGPDGILGVEVDNLLSTRESNGR